MNLDEIARLSGVSRSTVSRVVNNDPKVSQPTRAHVQEILQRLNYRPHAAARSLAAGRTRVLGLVIPTGVSALFADPFFPLLIQGVSASANSLEHSVMLWVAEPEYERRTIGQVMHSGLIDGVILASMLSDDPLLHALTEGSLPFILVGRHPTNETIHYVDVDNINTVREAVSHLLRLGRRRIATITGPQNMSVGVDRAAGYSAALAEFGLPLDPSLIVEGDFTEAGAYALIQRLLPFNPDAIFAASDSMAVGALRALRDAGRRVPEDVALVGFDDLPFAAHTDPPLTTIRQPVQRLGELVVETLIDLIQHPSAQARRTVLPTQLIIRASCGAQLTRSPAASM